MNSRIRNTSGMCHKHIRWLAKVIATIVIALPSLAAPPTLVTAQVLPPRPDVGDAPDSIANHAGVNSNMAYPNVVGNFPTVWETNTPIAGSGPAHLFSRQIFLGLDVSGERDADLGPDDDGRLNILDGGTDNSDNDRFDDGWLNKDVRFHDCANVTLRVRISRSITATNPPPIMYLNSWFDGNRDGDWDDTKVCPLGPLDDLPIVLADDSLSAAQFITAPPLLGYEWVVQNQAISVYSIPPGSFRDFIIPTKRVMNTTPGQNHWLRFTLSGQVAPTPTLAIVGGPPPLPDGRGLPYPQAFQFGETEDYKQALTDAPQPGTLIITKTAIAPGGVRGSDSVIYRIDLEHVGGAADALTTIKDSLPEGVGLVGPISVTQISGAATPLSATAAGGVIRWTGELSPSTRLRVSIPVRLDPCVGANKTITNVAYARNIDGSVISDDHVLNVSCSPPPNVDVKKEVIRSTDLELIRSGQPQFVTNQQVLPDDELLFRITARNNGTEPAVIYLRDELPQGVRTSVGNDPSVVKARLEVGTGLTATLNIPARIADRCDIGRVVTNVAEYVAVPGTLRDVSTFDLPASLPRSRTNPVTLRISCHDLGDAPDSTNHFGANMLAYPGTQANFPTVFDAATGADQGPLHRNPHPFHLGRHFSVEAEADIGPDQDGPTAADHNIAPTINNPDNDRKDDGVRVDRLVLTDCATTTIPVQVFIGPDAAAFFAAHVGNGNGYINVWVDGNRDGDWADFNQCGSIDGNRPALEHIVIDHQINLAALGMGLHTITVPTALVPWPTQEANKPAWLRFTLSEAPSNKSLVLNGRNYGDGRGIAPPFVTGETEDYLWQPQPAVDVAIRKRGAMRTDSGGPITSTTSASDYVVWQIKYANLGSAEATGVVITDDLAQAGNKATFNVTSVPPLSYTLSGNALTFNVGTLAPGAEGTIMLELQRSIGSHVYTNTTVITATGDVDAANNTAVAEVKHNFIQPPHLYLLDGTTCDGDFTGSRELLGITTEFATVDLYIDGVLVVTTQAGGSGYFRHEVVLPDGEHTLYAVARVNGEEAVGQEHRIIVNSALSFDPISLSFKRDGGGIYHPTDDEGRLDETGWDIHLAANETYTVSVRLCCESPTAQVTLIYSDTELVLTDSDGDRVFEGVIHTTDVTTVESTLSVNCDGNVFTTQSQVLIDPEGVVYDINTGAPLSGAQAMCIVRQEANYSVWPATDFDQVNPQTTDATGYFSFLTPPGVYRLDVSKTGYQPYHSPDLTVVSTPVRHDVPLTPINAETPNVTIGIGENGFDPLIVRVTPNTVIAIVNADVQIHHVVGQPLALGAQTAAAVPKIDTGALGPNQSHTIKLASVGTYRLIDSTNAELIGVIVVEGVPRNHKLLLPILHRQT